MSAPPPVSTVSKELLELGIDTEDMIYLEDEKTPTAFVLTDSSNDQISYFYWGAAACFKTTNPPYKAIEKVKAVHLATGDPGFNRRSGSVAHEAGKLISFDPTRSSHVL